MATEAPETGCEESFTDCEDSELIEEDGWVVVEKPRAQLMQLPSGDVNSIAPIESTDIASPLIWGGIAVVATVTAVIASVLAVGATVGAIFSTMAGEGLHGDMRVMMAEGSPKKIRDIKIGDEIWTFNEGQLFAKPVTMIQECPSRSMHELHLETPAGKAFSVKATARHPFFTKGGWAMLCPDEGDGEPLKLKRGDMLAGVEARLVQISRFRLCENAYKLGIDGPGTLFVEGVLSHSGLPPQKSADVRGLQ